MCQSKDSLNESVLQVQVVSPRSRHFEGALYATHCNVIVNFYHDTDIYVEFSLTVTSMEFRENFRLELKSYEA